MMSFYEADSLWQIILLIFSQFTVILLASGMVFLYKRKSRLYTQAAVFIILLINMTLYMLMQLGNRLVSPDRNIQLQIPCIVLLIVTGSSFIFLISVVLNETRNRKTISQHSIKEAFDTLPAGICFFSDRGMLFQRRRIAGTLQPCNASVQFRNLRQRCPVYHRS